MIWKFALKSDSGALCYNSSTKRFDVSDIGASLLTTCHAISAETLHMPVHLNTLVFATCQIGDVDLWVLVARLERLEQVAQNELRLHLKIENNEQPVPVSIERSSTDDTPDIPRYGYLPQNGSLSSTPPLGGTPASARLGLQTSATSLNSGNSTVSSPLFNGIDTTRESSNDDA